jgi:TolB protein
MTLHNHTRLHTLHKFALLVGLVFLIGSISSCGPQTPSQNPADPPTETINPTFSPTTAPTQTPYIIIATPENNTPNASPHGLFFLAMADAGYTHLFAYSPDSPGFTRLTSGKWDDVAPALSPDHTRLAFTSNRNGYWNIYILELRSGAVEQLTDSPEYKGEPSWSSDGAFITYTGYMNGSLEIMYHSATDKDQAATPLTQDPALDTQPAWSPQGRQIAFVSTRSGELEIWVADLDNAGIAANVSLNPQSLESHPAWSADGKQLLWSATDLATGLSGIYLWDSQLPGTPARWIGAGNWPVWMDSNHLAAALMTPNQVFLTAFDLSGGLALPPILLPGPVAGLAFGEIAGQLPGPFLNVAAITPAPLYTTVPNPPVDGLPGRYTLSPLKGVQAAFPEMHELADDSFQALREQVSLAIGWDALASLENAYIPLTTGLDPGLGEDWLYTGRAFTLNPALVEAGWMAIVREDFGQKTYWRIYLRTTAQDGSQGTPLTQAPWDFSARSGNPSAYENGGQIMAKVPVGYWFDLTSLALQYGWERLPALTNWRTYYGGTRYNELAYTQGLDWRAAMLQLYPPEVLVTPTVVIPPTRTPTRTPFWYQTPTPTRTPTSRPTNTP